MNFADLLGPDGSEDNMGGTAQVAYYSPVSDFLVIQKRVANPTTLGELAEITLNHTFKQGKCFKKIYCTLDKGQVDHEPQGERDGRSFKSVGKIFYPGAKKEAMGFSRKIKNDRLIFLFPLADGTVVQVGTELFPAEVSSKFTTATNSSGVRGWEFEVSAMETGPILYSGDIALTPAV